MSAGGLPPGINLQVSQNANINWQNAQEGDHGEVTLKGSFQGPDGRTFNVTVTYNRDALQQQFPGTNFDGIDNQIQQMLGSVETSQLAALSGHKVTAGLDGRVSSVLNSQGQPLRQEHVTPQFHQSVMSIQNIFSNVFPPPVPQSWVDTLNWGDEIPRDRDSQDLFQAAARLGELCKVRHQSHHEALDVENEQQIQDAIKDLVEKGRKYYEKYNVDGAEPDEIKEEFLNDVLGCLYSEPEGPDEDHGPDWARGLYCFIKDNIESPPNQTTSAILDGSHPYQGGIDRDGYEFQW